MATKMTCLKCKKKLEEFRMVLTHGPMGYRRYAMCHPCADRLGVGAPKIGGRQRAKARSAFGQGLAEGGK
jgi:hypothetical protein